MLDYVVYSCISLWKQNRKDMQTTHELKANMSISEFPEQLLSQVSDGLKMLKVRKVLWTVEDYYNSPEFAEVWDGYTPRKSFLRNWGLNFICGLVVPCDPSTNYGREFRLFAYYTCEDGLEVCSEESVISCLSSSPFQVCGVFTNYIFVHDLFVNKNDEGRAYMIKTKSTSFN